MNFNLVEMYGNNPIVQTYWTAEHNIGNANYNSVYLLKKGVNHSEVKLD